MSLSNTVMALVLLAVLLYFLRPPRGSVAVLAGVSLSVLL